ncbi:MAG: formylglycine-generating enzyme family protein [Planctomycetota bacterium]
MPTPVFYRFSTTSIKSALVLGLVYKNQVEFRYIISDVPVGKHSIKVIKPGMQPIVIDIDVKANDVAFHKVDKFTETEVLKGRLVIKSLPKECHVDIPELVKTDMVKAVEQDALVLDDLVPGSYTVVGKALGKELRLKVDLQPNTEVTLFANFIKMEIGIVGTKAVSAVPAPKPAPQPAVQPAAAEKPAGPTPEELAREKQAFEEKVRKAHEDSERAELTEWANALSLTQVDHTYHFIARPSQDAVSHEKKLPIMFQNDSGIQFVLIPAGKFQMGSPSFDDQAGEDEKPQHPVKITQPFYMSSKEITRFQWKLVMGIDPSKSQGNEAHPVENISWDEAQQFVDKLNEKEGRKVYSLPTEAQWEYACRAGTSSRYHFGDEAGAGIEKMANYCGYLKIDKLELTGKRLAGWQDSDGYKETAPVGSFPCNQNGLQDMAGNVWEWCADWYASDYYGDSPAADPMGPPRRQDQRVVRGGSWNEGEAELRSAKRKAISADARGANVGMRLVRLVDGVDAAVANSTDTVLYCGIYIIPKGTCQPLPIVVASSTEQIKVYYQKIGGPDADVVYLDEVNNTLFNSGVAFKYNRIALPADPSAVQPLPLPRSMIQSTYYLIVDNSDAFDIKTPIFGGDPVKMLVVVTKAK